MKTLAKYIFTLSLILSFSFSVNAQKLYHINLRLSNYKAAIRSVELTCDSLLLRVDSNGNVSIHPMAKGNFNYYAGTDGRPQSFGNISFNYYDGFGDKGAVGKLKSINNINITYYDQFNSFDNIGKVKSIGNITFAYNEKWDGFDNLGKLKSIGDTRITYFDRFDGGDNIGKLKSIGNTTISWFNRFDARENFGKLKAVNGNTPYLNIIRSERF